MQRDPTPLSALMGVRRLAETDHLEHANRGLDAGWKLVSIYTVSDKRCYVLGWDQPGEIPDFPRGHYQDFMAEQREAGSEQRARREGA